MLFVAGYCGSGCCLGEYKFANICFAAVCLQIDEAFESAVRRAAAVELPADMDVNDTQVQRSVVYARRRAAEAELKQQLAALGLDVSGLAMPPAELPADLLSLARPLAEEAAAETVRAWR